MENSSFLLLAFFLIIINPEDGWCKVWRNFGTLTTFGSA
jgi:hypothetical protein